MLVPLSATIGAFTGALMQFISDLSKEHVDFLAAEACAYERTVSV